MIITLPRTAKNAIVILLVFYSISCHSQETNQIQAGVTIAFYDYFKTAGCYENQSMVDKYFCDKNNHEVDVIYGKEHDIVIISIRLKQKSGIIVFGTSGQYTVNISNLLIVDRKLSK